MMSMNAKKSKYQEYGNVYQSQCVHCAKEGTYKCALMISDGECLNYTECDGDCQFGGY